jgi:uncharacterized protein
MNRDTGGGRCEEGAAVSPPVGQVPDLNGLMTTFVERVDSVAHAIVVSADGLPIAFSRGFPPDRVDQLAAVASGLASLTQGASRVFEGGVVNQTVVEMQRGVLIMMSISDGSSLALLAAADCDMGLVAYEMVLLVEQVGSALTPGAHGGQPSEWPGISGSAVNGNGGAGETKVRAGD